MIQIAWPHTMPMKAFLKILKFDVLTYKYTKLDVQQKQMCKNMVFLWR